MKFKIQLYHDDATLVDQILGGADGEINQSYAFNPIVENGRALVGWKLTPRWIVLREDDK